MEDTLITFKTAKLAKEKGFNIFTDVCFANTPSSDNKQYKKIKLHHSHSVGSVDSFGNILTIVAYAPTQSLLAKWLREEHGIHIELLIDGWGDDNCVTDDFLCYRCFIWQVGKPRPKHNEDLGAGEYEKMFEIGLQEALKLIKND